VCRDIVVHRKRGQRSKKKKLVIRIKRHEPSIYEIEQSMPEKLKNIYGNKGSVSENIHEIYETHYINGKHSKQPSL